MKYDDEIEVRFIDDRTNEIAFTLLFDKDTVNKVADVIEVEDPKDFPEAFADFCLEALKNAVKQWQPDPEHKS